MNNFGKNLALWIIIGVLLVALFNLFQGSNTRTAQRSLAYSDFLSEVESGRVNQVTIQGQQISGRFSDGSTFQTYAPQDAELVPRLNESGVRISAAPPEEGSSGLFQILISWFPMLLFIAVWIFFMRQMQGGGGKAMGFGKSRARLLTEKTGRVTFDDVAGIDEAKSELEEIVEFLKDPQRFQRLGGKIPKGCLLVGPPGTGKTLLARAIAGEANVPFFTISGSDFVEMFVGVGASRVRDMFEQGKKNAPCIIFIDEIDAVGRHRGAGLGGGNDEREQTLNQLLVEMDGFEANEGVILIAATNRPDVLDPALLRPGRFDRQIVVPNPDILGREKILKVHMRKVPLGPDVDARTIARGTPGFSGADLANLVNEAALLAARKGKRVVGMTEFEEAKDKVMMGSERRSMVMTDDEKKLTAYHEAGHAIVALHCPDSDPIHKATIIPRGRALGMVMRLPEGDRISLSKAKLEADLRVACGGRIAEDLIFGAERITTGASSDIRMVSDMSRRMITEWGMSDKLGFLAYSADQQEVFLGHSVTQQKNVSDATANVIDEEIRRITDEAYDDARRILEENMDDLHKLAKGLLEYESLPFAGIITVIAFAISVGLPYLTKRIPSALTGIIVGTGFEWAIVRAACKTRTTLVGDIGSAGGSFPVPVWFTSEYTMPALSGQVFSKIYALSILMAVIGILESAMTLSLINERTKTKGNVMRECVGQGIANLVCGMCGGMGGCAMLGQSMINISSGARGRLSTFCCSVFLVIILLAAYPAINIIPVAALAGVMFNVVYQTFEWGSLKLLAVSVLPKSIRQFLRAEGGQYKKIRRTDAAIIVVVTVVTMLTDLAVAVGCGILVACLMHVYESDQMISVAGHLETDAEGTAHTKVYTVQGVLFFGSVARFLEFFDAESDPALVRLIFEAGYIADYSALEGLNKLGERYGQLGKKITLQLLHPGSGRIVDKAANLLVKELRLSLKQERVLDQLRSRRHIEGFDQSLSFRSGFSELMDSASESQRIRRRSSGLAVPSQ